MVSSSDSHASGFLSKSLCSIPRRPDEPRVRSDEELDAVGDQPNPQNAVSIAIGLPQSPSIPERRICRESLSKLARVSNESNVLGWTFLSAFSSPTSPGTSCSPWIPLVNSKCVHGVATLHNLDRNAHDTPRQRLEWAMDEVFKPRPTTSPPQEQPTSVQHNCIYPHIIAALMRTLRDVSTVLNSYLPSLMLGTYPFFPTCSARSL